MVDKKGQIKNNTWLFIILAAVLVLFVVPNPLAVKFGTQGAGTAQAPVQTTTPSGGLQGFDATCPDPSQGVTMTNGPMKEKGNPTTNVGAEQSRIFINGIDNGLTADSGTLTVKYKDQIENFYGVNSSLFYASKVAFSAPCGPFRSAQMDGGAHELIRNTTLTRNVFNPTNGNLNSAAENESIAAGNVRTFDVDVEGSKDQGFSPYGKVLVVLDLNRTDFVEADTSVLFGGKTATPHSIPLGHTDLGADFVSRAYELDVGCGKTSSLCDFQFKVQLVAEEDLNPGPDTGANVAAVNISFYDQDWFLDPDVSVMKFDYENTRGNISGQVAATSRQVTQIRYI